MALNFRGGPPKPPSAKPTDPIKIFESRPAISSQINDLWRGQAEALRRWHEASENDVLIALNTGAGKSVVGVLICQSMLNKRLQNPVYLCATNDLVEQTAAEAEKLSLDYTIRTGGDFSNDKFEEGRGFLITSYQTLLNSRTKLRGPLLPRAILFDDAHVGEPTIRGQFTLRLTRRRHRDIHSPVAEAILGILSEADRRKVSFIFESQGTNASFLCPPEVGGKLSDVLLALTRNFEADGYADVLFPFLHLNGHWDSCAIVVTRDEIEISPPFLPTRTLPAFRDDEVKRVYLSATLKAESEFVRAYGRKPGLRIEPEVDAGNGERTIINSRKLTDHDLLVTWSQRRSRQDKILVAVPSKRRAEVWNPVAQVPERNEFIAKLNQFRAARTGGFVLAGRFDGIDLPDTTCRLMVLAGLPAGGTNLETHLWQSLEMQNLLAARVATRVTQLFGRIIRGRNDYGFFLIQGRDLISWLARDRNVALLPDLLQKQIKIGEDIQEGFDVVNFDKVDEFYKQVLDRDPAWLDYYRQYVDGLELDPIDVAKRLRNEQAQMISALAESRFAESVWQGRYGPATDALEAVIDEVATGDSKLGGWLNLWAGAASALNGNSSSAAEHYSIAKSRLVLDMDLPTDGSDDIAASLEEATRAVDHSIRVLSGKTQRAFQKETSSLVESVGRLSAGISPSMSEEAYRSAGTLLGFTSTRPDNDFGVGPDVLWVDDFVKEAISFELKTDKAPGSQLTKKEIGQSHNHVQWLVDNHPELRLVKHFIVGTELSLAHNANPDPDWCLSAPHTLIALVSKFVEEARQVRTAKDEAALRTLRKAADEGLWSAEAISEQLCSARFDKI